MLKLSDILYKKEDFGVVDKEIEETLIRFCRERMRGLSYKNAEVGYSFTRFKFTIENIDTAIKYKNSKEFHEKIAYKTKVMSVSIGIDNFEGVFYIDIPNKSTDKLYLGNGIEYLECISKNNNECLFYVGESVNGRHCIYDFADSNSCHFLIGGGTGYGKSTLLHTILIGLLARYNKKELEINFIDLKKVTANSYKGISQVTKVVEEKEDALAYLHNLIDEMQRRNEMFKEHNAETIGEYNDKVSEDKKIPRIVVVIDEADALLGMTKKDDKTLEIIECVRQLAALARSEGIHLILASQKPTGNNIPTSVKANIHGRIAFKCESAQESIAILERKDAKYLAGVGDSITKVVENNQVYYLRTQIAYMESDERQKVQELLRKM